MCIRDRVNGALLLALTDAAYVDALRGEVTAALAQVAGQCPVSYTHLRAHETVLELVCRLLLEKQKQLDLTSLRLCHRF